MCGLCGVYGIIGQKERHAFSMLSMLSQLRGKDSTGVGLVYHNKKRPPKVVKSVGGQESLAIDNPEVFDTHKWVLKDDGLLCVIGHNRWATVGDVNEENAHPFHSKHIIGCHNGTVKHHELNHLESYHIDKTDSQILIEELSNGKSAKEVIEYVHGAWALTWFDTKQRRLHMCRNKERTLFCARADKALFWASESWMLEAALIYYGVKYSPIEAVVADRHIVWVRKGNGDIELEEINEAVGGKWLKKIIDTVLPSGRDYNEAIRSSNVTPMYNYRDDDWAWETDPYAGTEYAETSKGNWVRQQRYESLIKDGCAMCTGDLSWEDRGNITWVDWESPLCPDCAQHKQDKEAIG